jgi:hypothetical protein
MLWLRLWQAGPRHPGHTTSLEGLMQHRRLGASPTPVAAATPASTHPTSWLQGVRDSDALRAAVEEVQPENVKLGLRLSQSRLLFDGFKCVPSARCCRRSCCLCRCCCCCRCPPCLMPA